MQSALLVIDVQRGLLGERPGAFEATSVVARINAIATRARVAGVPVVFVQHERAGALERDSHGWFFCEDLVVESSDHVVAKSTPDSFLGTSLLPLLGELGVEHLVICGYASEFCVDTTVRRAAALGFQVTVVADGHTTHDKPHATAAAIRDHHNATLSDITSFGPAIEAVRAADVRFGA